LPLPLLLLLPLHVLAVAVTTRNHHKPRHLDRRRRFCRRSGETPVFAFTPPATKSKKTKQTQLSLSSKQA
jgi:hypothetical protein